MTKKRSILILPTVFGICLLIVLMAAAAVNAQTPERADVPLTNPSKPALIKISVMTGSITVIGYSGKTVSVEAVAMKREKDEHDLELDDDHDLLDDDERDEHAKRRAKSKGMIRITDSSLGLKIEEENNEVSIRTSWIAKNNVALTIKVPFKTNLKLSALNGGFIKVDKVEGELEASHTNGPVTLTNVSGSVVAHTTNGDVLVTIDKINLGKPHSFTSFNGDVDVAFPGNAKFNLKMKTTRGDIYSDFKLQMQAPPKSDTDGKRKGGKFVLNYDKGVYGLLNGGGELVQLKTYNGDIYIRKQK